MKISYGIALYVMLAMAAGRTKEKRADIFQ